MIRKGQRYDLRTPCCLVPLVFTFCYLFGHNDFVYRHTYEVLVLGTIRLLVSNLVVNFSTLFPLISVSISFVFTTSIFVVAETSSYLSVCYILCWQPSLKAMETSENSILSGCPVLRGPVSLIGNTEVRVGNSKTHNLFPHTNEFSERPCAH